jgi:hypothetical protein
VLLHHQLLLDPRSADPTDPTNTFADDRARKRERETHLQHHFELALLPTGSLAVRLFVINTTMSGSGGGGGGGGDGGKAGRQDPSKKLPAAVQTVQEFCVWTSPLSVLPGDWQHVGLSVGSSTDSRADPTDSSADHGLLPRVDLSVNGTLAASEPLPREWAKLGECACRRWCCGLRGYGGAVD